MLSRETLAPKGTTFYPALPCLKKETDKRDQATELLANVSYCFAYKVPYFSDFFNSGAGVFFNYFQLKYTQTEASLVGHI